MRKIVNEIWVLESFDAVKLAKYTRCLFQATLPLDDGLAMRLMDEACSKARELREVSYCFYLPLAPYTSFLAITHDGTGLYS
jgi:hypothetical protein